MTKLKLADLADDTPVKRTIAFPADLYRDITAYGAILADQTGDAAAPDAERLVVAMLGRFLATDRAFQKVKRQRAGAR